jgi:hypothetical protein
VHGIRGDLLRSACLPYGRFFIYRDHILKKTVLVHALSLAFTAGVASALVAPSAYAQQQTGGINGNAVAGSVITVSNKDLGINRNVTTGANGSFGLSQLPPGNYSLKTTYSDGTSEELNVAVSPGSSTSVAFAGPSVGQKVVITGRASRIDVKTAETSMLMNKEAIDRIPVSRDVTSVALLAPGATAGDTRIGSAGARGGNVPSLGGASPAENVYYINGFNVTNMVNGIAFNQVPFEGIASQDVKTGGYGPEYGRSLGGVLSITTKRGTNEWKGGVNVVYQPDALTASSLYAEKSDDTGLWNMHERAGGTDDLRANLWAGGPIIEDKLFFFGLVQGADIKSKSYGYTTQTETNTSTPQYLMKVDWNINDSNRFELTTFSDKSTDKRSTWRTGSIDDGDPTTDDVQHYRTARGELMGQDEFTQGGQNIIGKYTTYLTDDLTVSAMYGVGKYDRSSKIETAACQYVSDRRAAPSVAKGCWTSSQIADPNANDKRTALRLDAEWNLGNHGLRFGLDNEIYEVVDGVQYTGGRVNIITNLAPGASLANGYVNESGSTIGVVQAVTFENGGVFETHNSAYYIEDNWQVSKNVLASIGVRSESFDNQNSAGKSFIKVDNTIAPRLGVTWDVNGNQETKVFGSLGRYYIPVMSNTNVRLSGAETNYRDYYEFDGTFSNDKFELPGLGAQLGERVVISDGATPDPRTVVDPNIKPMYQDEFRAGVEQALANRWSVNATYTHRNLKSVMDDMCSGEGAQTWAAANGFSAADAKTIRDTVDHCFLYNPGGDLTANVDFAGDGNLTEVTIPAAALKFPKPKRTYNALELGFRRAWDGKWSLQGSYVLAFSKGNAEGYVKSDIGQDDAGISQDWDHPGLMEGSYGYLPNDRRHTVKVFGSYQLTPELRVGGNIRIQSGRPKNCFGFYNGTLDSTSVKYEDASFYCGGSLHPRGSWGRLPWTRELSLQATYEPKWLKGVTFQVDALNVLNERTVTSINENGEDGLGSWAPGFGTPLSTQNPRRFRFLAQYEW